MNSLRRLLLPVLLTSILVFATSASALNDVVSVHTIEQKLQKQNRFLNPEYLVILPKNNPGKKLPLMICLHGGGGRGSDIAKVEGQAMRVWRGLEEFAKEPCIVVVPQCLSISADGARTVWIPGDLNVLLQNLKATLPVDPDRVYLTGNSMGGYGTWVWAGHNPEHFAAVAPISGGIGRNGPKDVTLDIAKVAANLAKIPVYVFAGETDDVVPADRSKRMVEAIRKAGGKQAKLKVYPNEGHGAQRVVYSTAEYYDWIMSKTRSE